MVEKITTATAKAAVTVTDNSMGVKVTYVMVNSANSSMIIKKVSDYSSSVKEMVCDLC